MSKKKIYFIINPFSGMSRKKQVPALIEKYLDQEQFSYTLAYTEYAGHATKLAEQAVLDNYHIVVAVGGDGSVNEVAAALINTGIPLGILPGGSGNGFAMHLGIGRNLVKAIHILNTAKVRPIDTCTLNDQVFINLVGTGFDALVAYKVRHSTFRGLLAYLKIALLEAWTYKMQVYKIVIDGEVATQEKCLVVEVANGQMFGYDFVIAPQARLDGGILDVILVKEAPKWRYLLSLWRFFNRSFHKSSLVKTFSGKHIIIHCEQPMPVHFDGEGHFMKYSLECKINPSSLLVLVKNE